MMKERGSLGFGQELDELDPGTWAGLSKAQTDQTITEHVQTVLGPGDKISLPGVGQFEIAEHAARQGRNPQTGEPIDIPAIKAVKFKAGKALNDAVNG